MTHTRWVVQGTCKKGLHTNCKELLAVYYSLRSFKTYFQNKHVKIFSNSQVRAQIMNKMGTTKSCICNDITKNTAAHITGAGNVNADYESRKSYRDAEWMLNPSIFHKTINHLKSEPYLVCFASRLNIKLPKYITYKPNPYAYFIDDFSVYWGFYNCYLLPLFSLIRPTL